MKKIILLVSVLSIALSVNAQQVGSGYTASVSNFDVPLLSGLYATTALQTGLPQLSGISTHLLALRTTTTYNYQMQLASSFNQDDRMFFRKLAIHNLSNATSGNIWHELATRGENVFIGNQTLKGSLCLPNISNIVIGSWDSNNGNRLKISHDGYFAYIDYYAHLNIRVGELANGTLSTAMVMTNTGNVGIGTTAPTNKLEVNGTIRAKEVKVETGWADFVFADDYKLPTLNEVKSHINANKHLPGMPTEAEVKENGVNLGEMQTKLLQKIEELTLYTIQQQEMIDELRNEIKEIKEK